ncbi:MAG: tryptophan synthase subunit alpha [Planctomycetota bacterium]
MNRIEQRFAEMRGRGGKGLMPFVTAGDPSLSTTARVLEAVDAAGAVVAEVGIPFSDPIADGPVIQASMTRALEKGITLQDTFDMVRGLRGKVGLGLVAMVSYSLVFRYGPRKFAQDAAEAGFDGLIVPDLPSEEAEAMVGIARSAGLTMSLLVSPQTSAERAAEIARLCSGFVYVLSRAGVTGERSDVPADLADRLAMLRGVSDLPMAVGFGVSTAEQAAMVGKVADAVIVGSALVKRVHEAAAAGGGEGGGDAAVAAASEFVGELQGGLAGVAAAGR